VRWLERTRGDGGTRGEGSAAVGENITVVRMKLRSSTILRVASRKIERREGAIRGEGTAAARGIVSIARLS
jgi:hypothetical protein